MFGLAVPKGALYYCGSRMRREIVLNEFLRLTVQNTTKEVRRLLADLNIPPAVNDKRCEKCSLIDSCLPQVVVKPSYLQSYHSMLFRVDE